MNKVVYKYPWSRNLGKPLTVMLPEGAQVVEIATQNLPPEQGGKTLMLWIEHEDPEDPLRQGGLYPVTFEVFGTGHKIPADMMYQGTVHAVPYVWHVYRHRDY